MVNSEHIETESEARQAPAPVNWSGVKRIHVMGICGSAMGAFAGMLRIRGFEVRGSDKGAYPPMSTTLGEMGIPIMEGYAASNLDWQPDVVVVGNVIHPSYDEAVALRRSGIPHCSLPQALSGLFIADKHSVVVTGTHGKTTTSSMTAWLLHAAGLDPSFMIGGITGNFGVNHRVSDGGVFVVEGDEYDTAYFDKGPKFLHYRPRTASVNNIEFDHADIFSGIDAIEHAFSRFTALIPSNGTLVIPANDPRVARVASHCPGNIWTFGIDSNADIVARSPRPHARGVDFELCLPGSTAVATGLSIWGDHNIRNALTAAALAFDAGAAPGDIARALPEFTLPKKRQELRGVASGIPVIDDFAHHPTAIRATLRSIRTRYPGKRVVALFEVESNTSRRRVFQDDFAAALSEADRVWFCAPLEKNDNLPPEERLDMSELIGSIRATGTPVNMDEDIGSLCDAVTADARPHEDVIVGMSGRNFHGLHQRLLTALGG
ncbi:MAG: UDP-N-acetylmuramate:L-alanyl-gamma-D-glutamyl-meso-diaminopimelate ligase [Myxococcota bacterium]